MERNAQVRNAKAHSSTHWKPVYLNQEAQVRMEHGDTETFGIGKEVRQGCQYLFNMYSEFIMRKANLDEMEEGIRIRGRKINNLSYADDTNLISKSK